MKTSSTSAASVVLALLLAFSTVGHAYKIDAPTFLKLPRHCQAWFAGSVRAGKVKGLSGDLSSYEFNLRKKFGGAAIWMNHYCPALGDLIRLDSPEGQLLLAEKREWILRDVLKQMNYQLRHTGGEWGENIWLYAEVMKNRAYTYHLMGEYQNAVKDYSKSIEIYPPYLPAYWGLAGLYEEVGRSDEAVEVLERAAQHATKNKAYAKIIQERIADLKAQSSDEASD